jgi:23S rRNA (cytidine1920-2'-O)/16S rRNA (cytidine1409-2'-O)-methyltransferase
VHRDVIIKVCEQMITKKLSILDLDFSPIKGPEGNIEYLLYMSKEQKESIDFVVKATEITDKAHNGLS